MLRLFMPIVFVFLMSNWGISQDTIVCRSGERIPCRLLNIRPIILVYQKSRKPHSAPRGISLDSVDYLCYDSGEIVRFPRQEEDQLLMKDYTVVKVKVIGVRETYVVCSRFANTPDYKVSIDDLVKITYADGTTEQFRDFKTQKERVLRSGLYLDGMIGAGYSNSLYGISDDYYTPLYDAKHGIGGVISGRVGHKFYFGKSEKSSAGADVQWFGFVTNIFPGETFTFTPLNAGLSYARLLKGRNWGVETAVTGGAAVILRAGYHEYPIMGFAYNASFKLRKSRYSLGICVGGIHGNRHINGVNYFKNYGNVGITTGVKF